MARRSLPALVSRRALISRRTLGVLSAAWATWWTPQVASAGNDDEVLVGSDAMLTGGAVTAITTDGSALWYNPAGLGATGKQQVDVNGSAYTLRLWNIPEYLRGPDGSVADGNTFEAVVVPSALTYVRTLDERWTIGGGYFLTRWSDLRGHSELQFPDSGSLATWQLGYVQTYSLHNVIVGASYRQSEALSIGFGLIGMYNGFYYANELSGGIIDGIDSAFLAASEQGSQSHTGLQAQVGVIWRPAPNWNVGVSIRSPGIGLLHLFEQNSYAAWGFDATLVPGLEISENTPERPLLYDTSKEERTDWNADWMAPMRLRLGVANRIERNWWSVDVDFQNGVRGRLVKIADRETRAVDRKAVVNARFGLKRALDDLTTVGFGLFTDRNAERRDVLGVGRFDFYGGCLGAEFSNVHRMAEEERAPAIRFSTSLGVRYAYGIGDFNTIIVPPFYEFVAAAVDNNGALLDERSTRATAHELTLNLGGGLFF